MFSLMHTDFRYIVIALLVMVAACFIAAAYNDYLSRKASMASEPVVLRDWTYRDDRGNTYVVTSCDITDNYSLLIEDYNLTLAYIQRHVFLADVVDAV